MITNTRFRGKCHLDSLLPSAGYCGPFSPPQFFSTGQCWGDPGVTHTSILVNLVGKYAGESSDAL